MNTVKNNILDTENKEPLNKKQRQVFESVKKFLEEKGYSPSYRELQKDLNFSSPSSIHRHIHALEEKGYLELKNQARSLEIIIPKNQTSSCFPWKQEKAQAHLVKKEQESEDLIPKVFHIPFVAYLTEGMPLEMLKKYSTVCLPANMFEEGRDYYLLEVKNSSLCQDHICQGDLLVLEASQEAQAGDFVLTLVNSLESFVKLYYPLGEYTELRFHSPDFRL